MASDPKYRPDIDGIRALAVLAVVIFHAKLGLSGGYAGVDVFFVISGFLITGIILRELKHGTFSFVSFWERRIRRILPALAAVTAAILAAGWFLLVPEDYRSLGRQILALVLCASNVQLYREDGYFATRSEEKPALHTWSLSVEEQFYLAAPFLLWLAFRWKRQKAIPAALAAITALSFALAVYASYRKPSDAFFLLPFRAWELGVGSLLAMASPLQSPRWRSIASWAGLLLIAATFLFYPKDIRFPGASALPPVMGTALLIWAGCGNHPQQPLPNRLLSLKPFVWIGLISYSLYLWHWPVFAFQKYLGFSMANPLTQALLALATFLPAWLSYRFVETPFRRKSILPSTRKAFAFGGITAAALVTAAVALIFSRGAEFRLSPQGIRIAKDARPLKFRHAFRNPPHQIAIGSSGKPSRFVVWGDSHAMAILPPLDEAARELGIGGIAAAHSATAPVLTFSRSFPFGLNEAAPAFNQKVFQQVCELRKDEGTLVVILAARWESYLGGGYQVPFSQSFQTTVQGLLDHGIRVVLINEVPLFSFDPPRTLIVAGLTKQPTSHLFTTLTRHRERTSLSNAMLSSWEAKGAVVLDLAPLYADSSGVIRPSDEGGSFWQDVNHLSTYGSMKAKGILKKTLESLLSEPAAATP